MVPRSCFILTISSLFKQRREKIKFIFNFSETVCKQSLENSSDLKSA